MSFQSNSDRLILIVELLQLGFRPNEIGAALSKWLDAAPSIIAERAEKMRDGTYQTTRVETRASEGFGADDVVSDS